jgi:predicted transglutaminase-like cysteine proteinase
LWQIQGMVRWEIDSMNFSDKFYDKFVSQHFQQIDKANWKNSIFRYMIDSQYRITCNLNDFLNKQFLETHEILLDTALELKDKDPDKAIINILKWVVDNVNYVTDTTNWSKEEYWQSAVQTINSEKGDCEDMNGLVYHLAVLAGIPKICLWNCIGTTKWGGHYWLIYFSTKTCKFYWIDAALRPDLTPIKDRNTFQLNAVYKDIWYCFNQDKVYKPMYGVGT